MWHILGVYGDGSKPCNPGEHQNSSKMDVHPPKNGIYRYWSMAISVTWLFTYVSLVMSCGTLPGTGGRWRWRRRGGSLRHLLGELGRWSATDCALVFSELEVGDAFLSIVLEISGDVRPGLVRNQSWNFWNILRLPGLVNIQKTDGNITMLCSWVNPLFLWPFTTNYGENYHF